MSEENRAPFEGIVCAQRDERVGILEGLSHIHHLHISRLGETRNGLLYQTLDVSVIIFMCCFIDVAILLIGSK